MEPYLKQIADELKLIREELQLNNDLLMKDMGMAEGKKEVTIPNRPDIAEQLNQMFKRD